RRRSPHPPQRQRAAPQARPRGASLGHELGARPGSPHKSGRLRGPYLRGGDMISARELAARVSAGASAEQVCLSSLQAIDEQAALGAFIHVARDAAVQAAQAVDRKRDAGIALGPLAGVPIAIKDLLATRDAPTTCASRMLTRDGSPGSGWRPPYDAGVVERLRAADAVLIGK